MESLVDNIYNSQTRLHMNNNRYGRKGPSLSGNFLEKLGIRGPPTRNTHHSHRQSNRNRNDTIQSSRTDRKLKSFGSSDAAKRKKSKPNDESEDDLDDSEDGDAASRVLSNRDGEDDSEPLETWPRKSDKAAEKNRPLKKARSSALQRDDEEVAFWEKKLAPRGKSKTKSVGDEGLDELLRGMDEDQGSDGGNSESQANEDWLRTKRKKALAKSLEKQRAPAAEESDEESMNNHDGDHKEEGLDNDMSEDEDDDEELLDEGEDSDDGDSIPSNDDESGSEDNGQNMSPPRKVRENPYKPPIAASGAKYIPPSLRAPFKDDQETLTRLRKQFQGSLNRLSEANILTIVKDIERLVTSNPRQFSITCLIDLLMGLLCDRSILFDNFVVLHAAFISVMYRLLGAHFGAQFLERFVGDFQRFYSLESSNPTGSKETTNLISLLASLYSFQVVSNVIMFDYIRLLSVDLTDLNAELLLRLVKSCGPQLRSDNPSALKDVVILVQKAVVGKGEANLSVRVKFMVETILDLKNNKLKHTSSQMASEAILRMRKIIGTGSSEVRNSLKSVEPLGVGIKDIEQADRGGKWWLVGASWKNTSEPDDHEADQKSYPGGSGGEHETGDTSLRVSKDGEDILFGGMSSSQLLQLAAQHRMNNDIRRSIFTTLLSAADYKDCHLRLRRIGLNKKQQLEIPRILVYCAGMEEAYNPYYQLVAAQMCTEHRFRKAFQFSLWTMLRRLGESKAKRDDDSDSNGDMGSDRDEPDASVNLIEVVNVGKMYGNLISSLSLSISVLKVLNFLYLRPQTQTLVEVLLVSLFEGIEKHRKRSKSNEEYEKYVLDIFSRAKSAPQLITGLRYIIPTTIKNSKLVAEPKKQQSLKRNCRLAMDLLALLHSSTATT